MCRQQCHSRQQCHNKHQVCRRQCHNSHQVCSHQCHSSQLHVHQLWLWVKGSQHSRLTAWMELWWSEELKETWAEGATNCLQHSPFYLSSSEIWVAMAVACMVCCGIPGLFYSNNNNKDFSECPVQCGFKVLCSNTGTNAMMTTKHVKHTCQSDFILDTVCSISTYNYTVNKLR